MTLIVKELIVKSTIIDRPNRRNGLLDNQQKEEIINTCLKKLKRELRHRDKI